MKAASRPTAEPVLATPALAKAVARGDAAAVGRALRRGASPDSMFKDRATLETEPLLLIASREGHAAVVELLLRQGATVDLPSRHFTGADMDRPLDRAVGAGRLGIVRRLIDAGADVNGPPRATSPLHVAAGADQPEAARLLLEAGARVDMVDDEGETALDLARSLGYARVVRVLKNAKAKRGSETREGRAKRRADAAFDRLRQRYQTGKDAPAPDLARAAGRPAFRALVRRFEALVGRRPTPARRLAGVVVAQVPGAAADDLLRRHRSAFRRKCALLLKLDSLSPLLPRQKRVSVALFPTADKYEVIAATFHGGGNYGMGSGDVIAGLKKAAASHGEWDLMLARHDAIQVRFRGSVRSADKLATLLHAVCPDVVNQGLMDLEEFATELQKRNPTVYLWWD